MSDTENPPASRARRAPRTPRACDQCNRSRTRCNGEIPCWRCLADTNRKCQYQRAVRKRGPKTGAPIPQSSHSSQWGMSAGSSDGSTLTSPSTPSDHDLAMMDFLTPAGSFDTDIYPSSESLSIAPCLNANTASLREFHAPINIYDPVVDFIPLTIPPPIPCDNHNSTLRCRYPCLEPVLPLLEDILPPHSACDLLELFFADPEMTPSAIICPYVLSPVLRKKSLLRQTNLRPTSDALLVVILWTVSHTAPLAVLQDPTVRSAVVQRLFSLSMELLRARERGWWAYSRDRQDPMVEERHDHPTVKRQPKPSIDDVLSYILLTCVLSTTEPKDECLRWWEKAASLVHHLRLNSEAHITRYISARAPQTPSAAREKQEECRRVYWLAYSLDRHLSFTFTKPLQIHDSTCQVLCPLPEWIWRDLDSLPAENIPPQHPGPPMVVSGTGFFEYVLPLMAILGDIIEMRARARHPRLRGALDTAYCVGVVEAALGGCEHGLHMLRAVSASLTSFSVDPGRERGGALIWSKTSSSASPIDSVPSSQYPPASAARIFHLQKHTEVVFAYTQYMIWFLRALLVTQSGAMSVGNENLDGRLSLSAAHARAAKECAARILEVNGRLSFMSLVFGVYLERVDGMFLGDTD
ncbi:fungal-specific transcription factor domain-containing protein [Aspergillus carlsbadensis]|nr:fungal-specific transcription factor domain-containing protein [Aspergillus carlsbadensis]